MAFFQEQFFLDQQSHHEAHFTDFQPENGEHNHEATTFFNPWPSSLQTPQVQRELYTSHSSSLQGSYVSYHSERVDSPLAETVQPTQLQTSIFETGRSRSYQSQSARDDIFSLETKHEDEKPAPFSSQYLTTADSTSIETFIPVLDGEPPSSKLRQVKVRPGKSRKTSSSSSEEDGSSIMKAKHAHSVIERRYRDNLNGKIMELHRILLAAETNQTSLVNATSGIGQHLSLSSSSKVSKSDIMTRAIDYVGQTEIELRDMTDEIKRLQEQLRKFQELIRWQTRGFPKNTMQFDGQRQ